MEVQKVMNKKHIIGIIICISVLLLVLYMNPFASEGKITKTFGNIETEYEEHIVNGFEVKGDYGLVRTNIDTGNVLTEKVFSISDSSIISILPLSITEPDVDCLWKKKVVFMNEDLVDDDYYFYSVQSYPVYCWEVRFSDGITTLYDMNANEIGWCTPCPSAYIVNGPVSHDGVEVCGWVQRKDRATMYFEEWFGESECYSECVVDGDSSVISHLSDSSVDYVYEIAHGNSIQAKFDYDGDFDSNYFTNEDANTVLSNRNNKPIKFTYLGNCGAMNDVGINSINSILRNHQNIGAVSVGYTEMAESGYWSESNDWEGIFFSYCGSGHTVQESYDYASSFYPGVSNVIITAGDTSIVLNSGGSGNHDADFNGDGELDIQDVKYLASYLVGILGYEVLFAEGDVDSSGIIDAGDCHYLVMYLEGDSLYSPLYP